MFTKSILTVLTTMGLAFLTAQAAEPIIWYSGAFEVEGTNIKTTTTSVTPLDDGSTRFTLAFKDAKSNQGFAQFPLRTTEDCPAFDLELTAEKAGQAEIWLEGDGGWKFQRKIEFKAGKSEVFTIEIKELTSVKCQWLRVVLSYKDNPTGNVIVLKNPKFVK